MNHFKKVPSASQRYGRKGIVATTGINNKCAIRKYDAHDFDELVAVIYDENFEIIQALQILHKVVGEYASCRKYVNAHILIFKGPILTEPRTKCIKQAICN